MCELLANNETHEQPENACNPARSALMEGQFVPDGRGDEGPGGFHVGL